MTKRPVRRHGGLVWQSIRWRLGSSVVFFVVAAAAAAAATAGPIYLQAADESVTYSTLVASLPSSAGVNILPVSPASVSFADAAAPFASFARVADGLPGGSGGAPGARYGPPIVTIDEAGNLPNPRSGSSVALDYEARTDLCAHVHIVAGHCPQGSNEVIFSTRSAALIDLHLGSHVTANKHEAPLVVVGLYAAGNPAEAYWWGENPFAFGVPNGTLSEFIDDAFVSPAAAVRLAARLPTSVFAQVPLRPGAVRAVSVSVLDSELNSYESSMSSQGWHVTSGLPVLLQGVQGQENQMHTIVAAVALELVLLALLVLYQVAAVNGAERSGDLEIAELRGLSRASVAALALREPALLLAVATPTGLLLGWLLVALVAPHVFEPGTRATVDTLAVWVAVGTLLAGFAAAALGSRRLVRPTLGREGRTAAEHRRRRNAVLVDVIAVVLAGAAVVELVATRSSSKGGAPLDPLASLTPGALALVAGILGARLLPVAARPVVRATRWSARVPLSLASRSVMRRAGVARGVVVLVIAVGVLVFSVAGYSLAHANRATQAGFQLGAPVVLTVSVAPGVNFLQAVEAADPSGHEAMAVAKISATSPTLAVDTSRLASIGTWPSGTTTTSSDLGSIAQYLGPPLAPEVTLSRADAVRLRVQLTSKVSPPPQLVLNVFDEQSYSEGSVDVGTPLHDGATEASGSLDGACTLACRLDSISVVWSGAAAAGGTQIPLVLSGFEIERGGAWIPVDTGLSTPGAWNERTSGGGGSVSLDASSGRLSADFHIVASGQAPSMGPDDAPPVLPSVVTTALAALNANPANPDQFPAFGLDGSELTSVAHLYARALPALGANGSLISLNFAQAVTEGPPGAVTFEVWCRSVPGSGLLHRLAGEGVTVDSMQTSTGIASTLGRTAPSLGFDLFVFAAIGAALLALGALMFAVAADSRRRSLEFAALTAVGVPVRMLRRSLVLEQVAVVVAGVLLGVVAGLVAGQLSLSLLPEFPPGRQGPTLPTSVWVGAGPALLAAALALVVLLAGGLVASLLTMRRVRPENVRLLP